MRNVSYVAGLFDGEGFITMIVHQRKHVYKSRLLEAREQSYA